MEGRFGSAGWCRLALLAPANCCCCFIRRLDQITRSAASRLQVDPEEAQERLKNVFISMVHEHYIERAPPASLPPPVFTPHPNSVKGRRPAKKTAGSDAFAEAQAASAKRLEEQNYEQ